MTALLALTGVTRTFAHLTAVDHIDLTIHTGARHAIIGPNGAGKTTLLHLIAGTLPPSSGRIQLSGRDVTRTGPARRATAGIARTFQTPGIWHSLSVLDNLVVAAWRHTGHRTTSWPGRYQRLAARCLHHLDTLGLTHLADTPAGRLPHGQRRLLEIGIALAGRPRLLLLDEPAAGLTDTDLPRLAACLQQLPAQVAVLLVEHHQHLVTAAADTLTVLHHGRILATGTPAQITATPTVVDVYLGTPARKE